MPSDLSDNWQPPPPASELGCAPVVGAFAVLTLLLLGAYLVLTNAPWVGFLAISVGVLGAVIIGTTER